MTKDCVSWEFDKFLKALSMGKSVSIAKQFLMIFVLGGLSSLTHSKDLSTNQFSMGKSVAITEQLY